MFVLLCGAARLRVRVSQVRFSGCLRVNLDFVGEVIKKQPARQMELCGYHLADLPAAKQQFAES